MADNVHGGALDPMYGVIIRGRDGSWSPYSQMGGMTAAAARDIAATAYGGGVGRVVKFTATVLCDLTGCPGHPGPDEGCLTEYTDPPRFPPGTPEYEEYRRRLRDELARFVAGEPPYEFGPYVLLGRTGSAPPGQGKQHITAEAGTSYLPSSRGLCGTSVELRRVGLWSDATCLSCLSVFGRRPAAFIAQGPAARPTS